MRLVTTNLPRDFVIHEAAVRVREAVEIQVAGGPSERTGSGRDDCVVAEFAGRGIQQAVDDAERQRSPPGGERERTRKDEIARGGVRAGKVERGERGTRFGRGATGRFWASSETLLMSRQQSERRRISLGLV